MNRLLAACLLHPSRTPSPPTKKQQGCGWLSATPITITADSIWLRQSVANLVSNATRITEPNGRVTTSGRTAGDELVIDGRTPGRHPVRAGAAGFERFWRAEESRTRQAGGSGPGLPIVRKLAEAHGGSATVTSVPGEGAICTLRIPVRGRIAAVAS